MKTQSFAIISYARTGSTFLIKALNSCSNLICHSEIFHPTRDAFNRSFLDDIVLPKRSFIDKLLNKTSLDKLALLRKQNSIKFLEHIYNHNAEAIGFKIFPGQDDEMMEHILKDVSIKKIVLERKSRLRSYVSQTIAQTSGKWDRLGNERAELKKIKIDIKAFDAYKRKVDNDIKLIINKLDNTGQQYLRLSYEEVTADFPKETLENHLGCNLLGLNINTDQKKQNPFSLEEMITNFKEVQEID